jgi:hypothetical protein
MSISVSQTPDFQVVLTNFCREDAFKRYVREAINTELFWRDILSNINFNNNMETKMKEKISNFKDKIENSVRNIIETQLNSYKAKDIPYAVSDEVEKQIPKQLPTHLSKYLDNNYEMRKILNDHIQSVTTVLYNSCKETLDKLTNDEQYHEITNSHIKNITDRCNSSVDFQLRQNTNNFNSQLSQQTKIFNDTMTTIISNANKSMETFDSFNRTSDAMKISISLLRGELDSFKTLQALKNTCFCIFGIGIVGFNAYMYFKK